MELNGAKILYTIHTNIPVLGDFKITQTLVSTWIVMALLSALAFWLGRDLKLENVSKRQAAAEFIVERLDQFVHDNMGWHFDKFIPLVGAIFALSIGCNLISVVGLWSPTADLNTEAAWAIVVFIIIMYYKIKTNGILAYLKGLLDPIFLMAPINVLSEVSTPVSMAFRHFGNILSAFYAKEMGLPIGRLLCASNSNNVLTDFIATGKYDRNRPFYNTVSPSMDILISSNLERLLYLLSGGDDKLVAGYMKELSDTGCYQVSGEMLEKIQSVFVGGFSSEEETEATIGKMMDEHKYLIDTHTAVAFHVLEQYRKDTGDQTKTVVASTASPFKFCDAVLDALHVTEKATGTALLDQLADVSGMPAPQPLATLKDKKVRFTSWTEKEQMRTVVTDFLK